MDTDEVNRTHRLAIQEWALRLGAYNTPGIQKLASMYNNGLSCDCVEKKTGSFNMCFKVVFADNTAWAVRFPIPGKVMYPDEKVEREVAVMNFVRNKTRIPTPKVIAWGTAAKNHDPDIGPFIITEWIEGISLATIMEEQPRPEWGPVLRDDIDDATLYDIFRQMAGILLELSIHDFDKIGALSENEQDGQQVWSVSARPMSLKMNEIESGGYVIMDDHSLPPFETTTDYLKYLIEQNIRHLHQQRNSIDNAEDARSKLILRRRLRNLVQYLVSDNDGPFKLFCDDLRPGNIIIDPHTRRIVALTDLEWMYTAPLQFLYSPPPWLILEQPASWTDYGLARYEAKFAIFIRALQDEEEEWQKQGRLIAPEEQRMSVCMSRFMRDGTFWFGEMVRESFNLDGEVLWSRLEESVKSRGLLELVETRVDEEEIKAFVDRKMEELMEYRAEMQSLAENES